MDLETQKNRVSHLSGEIKALKIARNYIDSAIKNKAGNLQSMRESTARMKVVSKGKERYEDYKERVKIIKKAIAMSNEQAIKEEINEMELRGKI
jgi:uncharacterized protein YjbJ (UPF0337 family)